MNKYKYKVLFKTDFSKGECEGECQAVDSDAATAFLTKELANDLMIECYEITDVHLTLI